MGHPLDSVERMPRVVFRLLPKTALDGGMGKYRTDYVLPPLPSTVHMAMNADLLAPGSSVFYLRGTTRECVPATVVGLSSLPQCVASYESPGHMQFYRDCPVERLTFPIARGVSRF